MPYKFLLWPTVVEIGVEKGMWRNGTTRGTHRPPLYSHDLAVGIEATERSLGTDFLLLIWSDDALSFLLCLCCAKSRPRSRDCIAYTTHRRRLYTIQCMYGRREPPLAINYSWMCFCLQRWLAAKRNYISRAGGTCDAIRIYRYWSAQYPLIMSASTIHPTPPPPPLHAYLASAQPLNIHPSVRSFLVYDMVGLTIRAECNLVHLFVLSVSVPS